MERALNFSNISYDELDQHVNRVEEFSFLWRTNVEVSSQGKRHQAYRCSYSVIVCVKVVLKRTVVGD